MWTRISTPAWRFQPKSDAEHPLLGESLLPFQTSAAYKIPHVKVAADVQWRSHELATED